VGRNEWHIQASLVSAGFTFYKWLPSGNMNVARREDDIGELEEHDGGDGGIAGYGKRRWVARWTGGMS
jgi:hypothetical protein